MRKIILWLIVVSLSVILVSSHNDSGSRGKCCPSCSADAKTSVSEQKFLSQISFEELLSGKILEVDLSSTKSVLVFMDKETVKDYSQVENFSSWLTKKNLDIKVYIILNGTNKEELKAIAKKNNILSALWAPSLTSKINVQKYPMAYYVVNGSMLEKTEKIAFENLTQMVWCERCTKVKDKNCCKYASKKNK